MFPEFVKEVFWHAFKDSAILFPTLFITYFLMELLEHKASERTVHAIGRAGRLGPLLGGLLGALPQCGFSAAASGLYSGGVITVGTLIAVFLSTSDEMFAVMVSSAVRDPSSIRRLVTIIIIKVVCAIAVGFAADLIMRGKEHGHRIAKMCEEENCSCHERGALRSALIHTLKVWGFIAILTVVVNSIIFFVGRENLASVFGGIPVFGELVAGLFGLIPNCASSVIITELYLDGVISAGQMMSGLFTGAGVGVLILFRANYRKVKENLIILGVLYVVGTLLGLLLGQTGFLTWVGL